MVKHRILLADDSVTIQKVVNLTFADEGIEVVAVSDGDAAMQKFVEAVPDLVMVDVNMPGADGYRICEMIKEDDETKHIPVILLVGSFEPFDEEEARRVGADDFLTKPFQSIRQLVNKVTDLLNGKRNASFGDEKAVSSFDDTLEMVKPVEEPKNKADFGDAAMDDEMIQTNQIGSLPVNEAQKFAFVPKTEDAKENQISENEVENSVEKSIAETDSIDNQDTESISDVVKNETDSEIEEIEKIEDDENFEDEKSATDSNEIPVEENLTKEILPEEAQEKIELFPNESQDEIEDTAAGNETDEDDDEPMPRHENIYEFANEQEFEAEETDESLAATKEIAVIPSEEPEESDSETNESNEDEIETDEPTEEDFQEKIETEETEPENLIEETAPIETEKDGDETPSKLETTQEFALDDFDLLELPQSGKAKSLTAKIAEMPTAKGNLSSEDIEAVAERVVEKLSRETIEQIVREVISQISKK